MHPLSDIGATRIRRGFLFRREAAPFCISASCFDGCKVKKRNKAG